MKTRLKIPLANINIGSRIREENGNIDALAVSLDRYGLIQPIVLNQANELIAGCRRFLAATKLGWTDIDVVYRETLSEDELRELELEENIRRKDMSWQERVKGIAYIHRLKKRQAALDSESWGFRETGELLDQPSSSIHYAVTIADLLAAGDKEIAECENLYGALKLIIRRREDEANAELMRRTKSIVPAIVNASVIEKLMADVSTNDYSRSTTQEKQRIYLSNALYNADCLTALRDPDRWPPDGHHISYIVTDPPYAIDVAKLSEGIAQMVNIDTVEAEHRVEENWDLLSAFIPLAFLHLRSPGWLLMWCDPENWYRLVDLCESTGFRVQKWPLVWCKTHACGNNQAERNWTKSVEFCLAASKGHATLAKTQSVCHFGCSNDETRRLLGHPFAKPLELWKWLYQAIIPAGHPYAVLDPFAGRGSSALAAIDVGLHPICIESNSTHFSYLYNNVKARYTQVYGADKVEFL